MDTSERLSRLFEHYRTLGAEAELELLQTLYRCLRLDAKLHTSRPSRVARLGVPAILSRRRPRRSGS